MIDWERVVSGEIRASSYCVRKASRKYVVRTVQVTIPGAIENDGDSRLVKNRASVKYARYACGRGKSIKV